MCDSTELVGHCLLDDFIASAQKLGKNMKEHFMGRKQLKYTQNNDACVKSMTCVPGVNHFHSPVPLFLFRELCETIGWTVHRPIRNHEIDASAPDLELCIGLGQLFIQFSHLGQREGSRGSACTHQQEAIQNREEP